MIDTTLTRMRCRATKHIRSHQGLITRHTEGVIQYRIENLGRDLVSVQWDNGVVEYVYPSEIEILPVLSEVEGDQEQDHGIQGAMI
jgi:hypothetical protein